MTTTKETKKLTLFLLAAITMAFTACEKTGIPVDVIGVTGVILNKSMLQLIAGDTETLIAAVSPGDATNQNVLWSSSNRSVAAVDASGKITAGSAGSAVIIASTIDGGKTAICNVTVISLTTDPGVVIGSIRWATRNVDSPGTFAVFPESAGMFYQWNKRVGWAATGDVAGWDNSGTTGTVWGKANDPCPAGWRVPTSSELTSLSNVNAAWTMINGVTGRLFGTASGQLFMPAAGFRFFGDGALSRVGLSGSYWGSNITGGLFIDGDGSRVSLSILGVGRSVRCVAEN
jgi:hypothetical protein